MLSHFISSSTQTFTEHLRCAKYYSKSWDYKDEYSRIQINRLWESHPEMRRSKFSSGLVS